MPILSYTASDFPFTPFTKILSNSVNTCFTDIRTLLNTTGLDDTNIQNAGITRATKLKVGTVNAILINNNSTGAMSELISVANTAAYFNASGVPTAGDLPLNAGGTGASLTAGNDDDVLKFSSGVVTVGVAPVPPPIKIYTFNTFV